VLVGAAEVLQDRLIAAARLLKGVCEDGEAVARCLPHPIRLDTPLNQYAGPREETVEMALAKIGARVGPDGKLYSAAGKEIYFDYRGSGGTPPQPLSEEQKEAEARAYRDLAARYTILTVIYLSC